MALGTARSNGEASPSSIMGAVTTGFPRNLVQRATLRRRRLVTIPHTVYPVRVLFGSMVLDATSFPTYGTGPVGVIEAGVVGGRLRLLVPPGLGLDARVDAGSRGRFSSEIGHEGEGPHVVLVAAVHVGSIDVEQWDPV
jgi:hypothetical protein